MYAVLRLVNLDFVNFNLFLREFPLDRLAISYSDRKFTARREEKKKEKKSKVKWKLLRQEGRNAMRNSSKKNKIKTKIKVRNKDFIK